MTDGDKSVIEPRKTLRGEERMKVRVEQECGERITEIHAVVLTGHSRHKNYKKPEEEEL